MSFAQEFIEGRVSDQSSKTPIQSASIRVFNEEQELIAYTFTDNDGFFKLQIDLVTAQFLKISALGFTEEQLLVDEYQNSVIELIPKPFDLDEVIVQAERPIKVKKDTVVFNAKAFAQGNEEVVEDLLKKIPGLSIDSEGTIKVGNQEVEKVMVEGDDFFERGYKILTKNMPAHPIEKVEVYQNYSNNRLLKGIEESDKIALNLKLNEDAKRIWFGDIELGYGLFSENRYEVRGNLMNFGKKNKYYLLSNLNNMGFDATGDINHLIRPFRINEPASIRDDQQVGRIIHFSSSLPNFKRQRTNFNNAELFSVNAIFNPSEKIKLKTLGFFNSDERDFFRNKIEEFEANQTNFTNTESYRLRNKEFTGFGKLDLSYDISKTKMLEAVTKYNSGREDGNSKLIFNGESILQKLESESRLFDQKISFTNKVNEKRVLLITGRFIDETSPQNFSINRYFYDDLFAENDEVDNVFQSVDQNMQFAGLEVHLLDRLENGDLLELQLGNQYRKDKLNTVFQLKDGDNIVALPEGFQNFPIYSSNDLYLKTKYRWELKHFAIIPQLDFHQLFNKLELRENGESESPLFINPSIGLDWEINAKNKITSSYSFNTTNAGILDVYDDFILTGFRSFNSGTGQFDQLNGSIFLVNYELGNWSDRFFANFNFYYSQNHDFISTRSFIEQNYSLSEKVLFKDRELFSINSEINRYFKFIRSNLKLDLSYFQSNYKNIVNNSGEREINSRNYSYGLEIRSGFKGAFNYHLGTKWTTSSIETNTFSNSFTDNLSFLDLSFFLSEDFDLQLKTERYFFGNLQTDNTYSFLDIDATYKLIPNKVSISLEGRNLFDTRTFRNYAVSDISTTTTSYRLLPRFAVLSLKYRL